jgi:endoglucanase
LSLTNTAEISATLPGDCNADATCTVADLVMLQKFLLGEGSLTNWKNADLLEDNTINGFDLAALRQLLLGKTEDTDTDQGDSDAEATPDASATILADFRKGTSSLFYASDGWSNGSCFNCVWRGTNATIQENALNLSITTDPKGTYDYAGAEYRSADFYGYGYYETSMQAISNDGVVSSFFTYTGPSDDNPWDEIDVEILGKDTTKVQFNYYTNGVGNHEYLYDLGFDASEGFHTYGFDWQEDSITWYVDGEAVYTATTNIPSTPGKIMMNVWNGIGVDSWLNAYDGTTPLTAFYQWVTYRAS